MSESLWFGVIHFLHQIFVHLFAVVHAFGFDLKCLVEKVVATGDEINEVADRSRSVGFSVEMDMMPQELFVMPPAFRKRRTISCKAPMSSW